MKRNREELDQDAEQYIVQEDEQDDDLDEAEEQKSDEAFKKELLDRFVDLNTLLKMLGEKRILREFQNGRPKAFLAVLEKLLSLELDASQEPQREEALKNLSEIKIPRIQHPQANYLLYCIGIKYAHRFTKCRDAQAAFYNKIFKVMKGGGAILACMQGDLKKLRNLQSLEYAKGQDTKFPPLCLFATANKQLEVLRVLHKHGKVLRSKYKVFDPLFHAAAHGLNEIIPVLFEFCGEKDSDPTIFFPNHFIDENEYSLKVKAFDSFGYGFQKFPILSIASAHGQLETVKLLQARGFKDEDMFCCLKAAKYGHFQVVLHLLSEFLNEQSEFHGIALVPKILVEIMEQLVLNRQEGLLQRIVKIFKKPENCFYELKDLRRAALQRDNLEIFIWVDLDFQADLNWILGKAILNGSLKILTYLFENATPKGKFVAAIYDELLRLTPTDAQYPQFKKSFHHLAEIGLDFTLQFEADGRNLQARFVEINHPRAAQLLSELGVDPSVQGHDGRSAYDLCQSIDMAMALLKFRPAIEVTGVTRICPFSAEQILEFNRVSYVSYSITKDKQKLVSDYEKILAIMLQCIEDQFVLIEKADPDCLKPALRFIRKLSRFSLPFKWEEAIIKREEAIKDTLLMLKLRIRVKGLKFAIGAFKTLSESSEVDEEIKAEALNKAKEILVEGIGIDPLKFAEDLKNLFWQYLDLKKEDLKSYEILLGLILGLEESLPQFILCRAIGEFLHAFGNFPLKDHHAYLCFNEAVKSNADQAKQDYAAVASLATRTLSELMEEKVDCEARPEELEAKNPKKFAEVIKKLSEESAKFAYLKVAASNESLLVSAAKQGNLITVRALFEQGQFNFENIGAVLIKAKDAALQGEHYYTASYLVVNAVTALWNRKLYQEGDRDTLQNLIAHLNRHIIPQQFVNDESLAKMQNLAAQKNKLNMLLCEIHTDFAPKALRVSTLELNKLFMYLEKTAILENYILQGYDASLFQEALTDDFIALFNAVLVMADHNSADRSLQNIINFLIEKLSSNRKHIALAIILNEYIHDKTLRSLRRIYLFNELSQSSYSSLEEFKQNSTFKLMALNLYIRAVWCVLLGWEKRNCGEIVVQLTCDDSAEFWGRYEMIKGEMDQFLASHPRPCHQYELFSNLESECMLAFIKGEQKLSFSEEDASRPLSAPGLFKKRPNDQKRAKPESEFVDNSMK